MAYRDLGGSSIAGDLRQEGVANAPGGLLEGEAALSGDLGYVAALDRARQFPLACEVGNELSVSVCVGTARAVVEVGNVEPGRTRR